MKVFLDCDEVLCGLVSATIEHINKELNSNCKLEDVKHYSYLKDVYGDLPVKFWSKPGIYKNEIVKPLDGSSRFVRDVIGLVGRYNVTIITSSMEGIEKEKEEFCFKHFGVSNVIHAYDKYIHTKDGIIVDDYTKHINEQVEHNDSVGILFNYNHKNPWAYYNNQCFDTITRKHRFADSYNRVLNTIKEYL